MVVFLSLYSCRQEDLLTDHGDSISKTITIQQLLKADLTKIPHLQNEITQLENRLAVKSSPNGKIYTDTDEGFSIDTEKVLYIEDLKGNKTYTFKIIRTENTAGTLENLVLRDIGNSEFEAFIATYDNVAVQNYKNLSLEELKIHATMIPIGKRDVSEIFGKANANLCQITTMSNVYQVYVPGTLCNSSDHHNYSQLADCTADVKPTSGYYTFATEYTTYDSCTGSTGSGTINTGPYGGYNGGGGLPDLDDPCAKAKPMIDKVNNVLQSPVGQQKIQQVLENKANDNIEWGVAIGQNTTTQEYEVTDPVYGTASSVSPPFNQLLNSIAVGSAHSHAGTPGSPSGGDMFSLLERMVSSNNAIKFNLVYGISNGNNETYALVVTDPILAAQFLTDFPRSANYDTVTHTIKEKTKLGRELNKARDISNYYYPNGIISGEYYNKNVIAMAYMLEHFSSGISLAKVNTNGSLQKIIVSLEKFVNSSGIIDEKVTIKKCPN
jgi:hypothetical protein